LSLETFEKPDVKCGACASRDLPAYHDQWEYLSSIEHKDARGIDVVRESTLQVRNATWWILLFTGVNLAVAIAILVMAIKA